MLRLARNDEARGVTFIIVKILWISFPFLIKKATAVYFLINNIRFHGRTLSCHFSNKKTA